MPTHHKGTPQEVQALDTFIKLTRATDSLLARLARRETFGDLTPRQFGVLEALHHLGPMRQGEISAKLLTSGGNVTLVVDNLEKSGLVHRERSAEDRRVVMVSLTEAGSELISQVFPKHLADIVAEMSILAPEEQEELGRLCRILGKQERAYD
jgi:MarR family 2-MHQ and catechol resistance regulon transcriptional repressor